MSNTGDRAGAAQVRTADVTMDDFLVASDNLQANQLTITAG